MGVGVEVFARCGQWRGKHRVRRQIIGLFAKSKAEPDSSSDDDGINDPLTLTTNMPSEGGRGEGERCQMAGRSIHLASIGLKSIGLRVDAAVRRVLCSALLWTPVQSS